MNYIPAISGLVSGVCIPCAHAQRQLIRMGLLQLERPLSPASLARRSTGFLYVYILFITTYHMTSHVCCADAARGASVNCCGAAGGVPCRPGDSGRRYRWLHTRGVRLRGAPQRSDHANRARHALHAFYLPTGRSTSHRPVRRVARYLQLDVGDSSLL